MAVILIGGRNALRPNSFVLQEQTNVLSAQQRWAVFQYSILSMLTGCATLRQLNKERDDHEQKTDGDDSRYRSGIT